MGWAECSNAICDATQPHARSFAYDSLRRLSAATNSESGTVSYGYDAVGNLLTKTDALHRVTCWGAYTASCDNRGYDALNRPILKSYSDGTPPVRYSYDAAAGGKGRLSSVAASGISTTNYSGYDGLGRITGSNQVTQGQTYSFSYGYNLAGALTSETYPSGRILATCYEGANRPASIAGTAGFATNPPCAPPANATLYASVPSSTPYWPHGVPSKVAYGNALWRTWASFNARLQATSFWDAFNDNPNTFVRIEYPNWLDPNNSNRNNGNLQSTTLYEGGPGAFGSLLRFDQSFGYDAVNRLSGASETSSVCGGSCWYRAQQYDAYGNMWVAGPNGSSGNGGVPLNVNTTTSNNYNAKNQRSDQSYDAAGNLQGLQPGLGLAYDAENRQVNAGAFSYAYDGEGRRVTKTSGGATTVFVYDALGQLAAEYNSGSAAAPPCVTCYLSYDHLGSVRLITDANAKVISRHDYLPFGEEIPAGTAGRDGSFGSGTDGVNQKFTGKERDQETGLDYCP
jgi:YD repeat-containing protein